MAREKIQDYTGKIIGFTEIIGTKRWLYDFYGKKVGYYDSATNKTYEWTGRFVGNGDILMTLLRWFHAKRDRVFYSVSFLL